MKRFSFVLPSIIIQIILFFFCLFLVETSKGMDTLGAVYITALVVVLSTLLYILIAGIYFLMYPKGAYRKPLGLGILVYIGAWICCIAGYLIFKPIAEQSKENKMNEEFAMRMNKVKAFEKKQLNYVLVRTPNTRFQWIDSIKVYKIQTTENKEFNITNSLFSGFIVQDYHVKFSHITKEDSLLMLQNMRYYSYLFHNDSINKIIEKAIASARIHFDTLYGYEMRIPDTGYLYTSTYKKYTIDTFFQSYFNGTHVKHWNLKDSFNQNNH